jgi:HTH-type transcriptional regulator/antitoxin HigA
MATRSSTSGSSARMKSMTRSTRKRFEVKSFPIHTEADHAAALARIEGLMSARPGTRAGAELEVLSILVEAYERAHHPIEPPDPIDAVRFRLEQGDLTRRDLESALGSRARVSEIKRRLTVEMIRALATRFHIPVESLLGLSRGAESR